MKPCRCGDADLLTSLDHWYASPLGQHVARSESACLEWLLADCFGHYLLQVGAPEQFCDAFQQCRIRHRVVLAEGAMDQETCTGGTGIRARIRARPFELPLASGSVDSVVLPHTLDFSPEAHRVLREVERVLIPEGRVILFCFNPLSTWGLMRWLPRQSRQVPWCGGQMTPFRIGDWLRLLGLQVETRDMLLFRPPIRGAFTPRMDWLDTWGGNWWPLFGGVYALRAVKRVTPLTPVRPRWRRRAPLLPGRAVEPTARRNRHG
ncbi:class I SAM-dependent methyltransferase [Thiohalocapsa marina]|uniref:Class I SAM-dependent methyltransferase n=1 Tax=Thiohalocapsa marina TaxID=424902 RepID=A0A5M8FV59_9GAMM|nr:methyltransferase domain-containing protein [Thiohalocapsa marina]KAA6187697.1 class I SAM-dependent methyltransferase [Thiohalocapsa marina]